MQGENVLLFHIGTHKTGTTALQNFLYNNCKNLNKYGWDYPTLPREQFKFDVRNGLLLTKSYLRKDENTFDKIMKYIIKCTKNYNIILSFEDFWILNVEKFFSKILNYYKNIKVVLYLRRQDKYIESLYNQAVKSTYYETRSLTEFIEDIEQTNRTNYLDELQRLEKFFGNQLIVRQYEKEAFQGYDKDIISDFLSLINIDKTDGEWNPAAKKNENISLTNSLMEIKRI